jgi:putative flippase GtrA
VISANVTKKLHKLAMRQKYMPAIEILTNYYHRRIKVYVDVIGMYMIDKLIKDKTDNTLIQLFRYTFVGGIAFGVDFGLLFLLTEFAGIHYLVSAAISFSLGLATNYILSISWVFNTRNVSNRYHEFIIFGIIGIVGLGMNELIIWSCTEYLHFYYLVSKIVSTIMVYLWNFFARKKLLFHSR